MVVAAPLPNSEITECEYKRQEVEFRQVLLSKFLLAMREDLAEWISSLTFNASITQGNFIESLQNGVILCQQARRIQRFAEEYAVVNPGQQQLKVPKREVYYTEKAAYKGSFVARDNVANFIHWCRELGIPDVCLFESDDLVMHKNEKSVILTLLDVARKAFKFGVQPPEIVRFEKEIDDEIEQDKEDERMGKPPPRPRDLEEDNNLDTMVRNIVNKCSCYDRFPIKKLADGKYQFGKSNTLIFVRVMRKHVMVRIGGGWDTFEHYITKHDPCRTRVAGKIDSSGNAHQASVPLPRNNSNNNSNSISPRRKKSAHEKRDLRLTESIASSDTWSMCSGSSEGSGSTDCCYNERSQHKKLNRKNSAMSTGSNGTEEAADLRQQNLQFPKSIEEIDRRLKSMENHKPVLDMTIKDPSVYENKADSWLRSHLNTLKQRRQSNLDGLQPIEQPMDEFILKRGYTADNIERRKSKKQETSMTPKLDRQARGSRVTQVRNRSITNPSSSGMSNSVDQGLDNNSRYCSSPYSTGSCSPNLTTSSCQTYQPTPDYQQRESNLLSLSSTSNQSLVSSISEPGNHGRSRSEIATQTDFSHLPTPLRKKAEKAAAAELTTSPSKIPRPVFQRSKTADSIPISSKLKRRNSTNSGNCASRNNMQQQQQQQPQQQRQQHHGNASTMPRVLRDKSGHSNRPGMRREKSDVTGQRSKYRSVASPGPVRRSGSMKKEKPVRIRNGPILTTAV